MLRTFSLLSTFGITISYLMFVVLILQVDGTSECDECIVTYLPSFDDGLIEEYEMWNISAPRYEICYRLCYKARKCLSFQYNSLTERCHLFASSFISPGQVQVSPDAGMKLFITCKASGRLGDSCSANSDCKQALTSCVNDLCNCTSGFNYSTENFQCEGGYVGCYHDNSTRILPQGQFTNRTHQTNEYCQTHCRDLGFRLAGTEVGRECFCGDSIADYPLYDDDECGYSCPGDPLEKCGGFWRISIYNTGY